MRSSKTSISSFALIRRRMSAIRRWRAQPVISLRWARAMIDTSDGLSTDLAHICEASGVGAKVWANRIPKVSVPSDLRKLGLDPLRLALDGGEDYELLFTVPRRLGQHLPRAVQGVP